MEELWRFDGGDLGTERLEILYGGVVSNTVGRIGAGRVGSTTGVGWVTVGGAEDSEWTNSGNLYFGVYPSTWVYFGNGTLTIQEGGAVGVAV